MNALQAAVLGIVQGLTEFLPISSSAHLVLVPHFLDWPMPSVAFDVVLHFGTLVAVIIYLRRDLIRLVKAFFSSLIQRDITTDPYRKLSWLIVVGTVPAAVVAILYKDFFEKLFAKPLYVGYFLLGTGFLLVLGELIYNRQKKKKTIEEVGLLDSMIVGCFQAAAIAPGISRSGATIASGIFRGVTRDEAARFSFLLAVPIILGATFDAVLKLAQMPAVSSSLGLTIGFVTAFVSGYLAIKYLLRYLKKGKLYVFAYYCWAIGIVTIIILSLRGA